MKPFNTLKDPDFQKWGLALALVLALGANLSFNPETKYIARNDGIHSGLLSLATSTPAPEAAVIYDFDARPSVAAKAEVPAAKQDTAAAKTDAKTDAKTSAPAGLTLIQPKPSELELGGKYKGYTAKLVHKDGVEEIGYHIVKTGSTEAGSTICEECLRAKVGSVKLDGIMKQDWSKDGLASKAILAKVTEDLDKLEKKAEPKPAEIAKNVEIKIKGERCARPSQKEIREGGAWDDFIECQKSRIEDFDEVCQNKVDEKIKEAKKAKVSSDKEDAIEKNVRNACKKTIDKFYTAEIKPFLDVGLRQMATPRLVRDRFGRFQVTITPTETHRAAFELMSSFKDLSSDVLSKDTSSKIDSALRSGTAQSVDSTYNQIFNNASDGYLAMGFDQAKAKQYASADAGRAVNTYLGSLRAEGLSVGRATEQLSFSSGDNGYIDNFKTNYWNPTQNLASGLTRALTASNTNGANIERIIQDYLNRSDVYYGNGTNGTNGNNNATAASRDNGRRPIGSGFMGQGAGVQGLPGMPGSGQPNNPVNNNFPNINNNGVQNGNGNPPGFPVNASGIRPTN